ncbi:MAG: hypothetical protein Q9P90_19620 [candidate division KSB1 bacterium]|nr:hypothetical protein [candidate division KSB1 bacterium]
MKKLGPSVIQVSEEEFRQHVDELLQQIKNGVTVVISENGHILATVEPGSPLHKKGHEVTNLVGSKEEALERIKQIEEALHEGRISLKDSKFFNMPPIDMGETDSSNLDDEIYQ